LEPLILQDLTRCDYFRTSVVFHGLDIYNIVGDVTSFKPVFGTTTCCIGRKYEKRKSFQQATLSDLIFHKKT